MKGLYIFNINGKQYRTAKKQDRQCMYNVTVRRVPATIVAVERQ